MSQRQRDPATRCQARAFPREALAPEYAPFVQFAGPGEGDETDIGGQEKTTSLSKKRKAGRGPGGKAAGGGAKDRKTAQVQAKVAQQPNRAARRGFGENPLPARSPGVYRR